MADDMVSKLLIKYIDLQKIVLNLFDKNGISFIDFYFY